jgi:hypothetical protein
MDAARELSIARRVSLSSIFVDSLKGHIEGVLTKDVSSQILSDLGRLDRNIKSVSGDVESLGEFLGLYVFHWLCYLTPLSESEKKAAGIEGREKFHKFIDLVKERRVSQRSVWKLLYEEEGEK